MKLFTYKIICMFICTISVASISFQDITIACGSCACNGQKGSADCSDRDIQSIPTNLPANTTDLNLDRNRIHISGEIQGELCQQYPWLTKLSLAWNRLQKLWQIFKGCNHLEHLNLMGNILEFPDQLAFEDLQNLQELSSIEVQELHMGIFKNLKKLETLNLTFYGITIQPGVFTGLLSLKHLVLTLEKVLTFPVHMLSFNDSSVLKSLVVKGPKVKDIPDDLLTELVSLKELHLDLPQLLELRLQDRKPQYLQILEISNVKSLAEDTLFGLHFLKIVKLHGIANLARPGLFKMANTVKELEIVRCSLTELPAGWLHNMAILEILNLSENGLEKLSPVDFLQLTSLKQLILSNNKIHDVSGGFFDPLKATLTQLLLNGNQLKKLQPATFIDMELLELLDLRKNTIRYISANSFSNLPQLQVLRLSGNYISSLDNVVFESFPMLREIDLTENMISQFPETVMTSQVAHLFLSANNLQYLPSRKICQMGRLQKLSLEDNPVFCDCSVRSLHKCLPQLEINGKCSQPADVEGRDIDEIAECIPTLVQAEIAVHSLQTLTMTDSIPSLLESTLASSTFTPPATSLSQTLMLMHASSNSPSTSTPSLSTLVSSISTANMISALVNLSLSQSPSLSVTSESVNFTPNLISWMTPNLIMSTSLSDLKVSGSQIWTFSSAYSRLTSSSIGLIEEAGTYYDDGGFDEIVRPLIPFGMVETSEVTITSVTDFLSTQLYNDSKVNTSYGDETVMKSDSPLLNNDTRALSPNMVQVPAMVEQTGGVWAYIDDIITAIFLSLAVTMGILAGVWFYKKKSQSGSYNPVTSSIEVPQGNTTHMQSLVAQQDVTLNQKQSSISMETQEYHISHE